jgi:uncharacterized Zn finger protein (UPF0148 family)
MAEPPSAPQDRCPRCGAPLSPKKGAGPCDSCLLALALDPAAEGARERVDAPPGLARRRRKRSV